MTSDVQTDVFPDQTIHHKKQQKTKHYCSSIYHQRIKNKAMPHKSVPPHTNYVFKYIPILGICTYIKN